MSKPLHTLRRKQRLLSKSMGMNFYILIVGEEDVMENRMK
eukprot:CAMPEP_0116071870 /NCGR_PEP_ID=MMETSP0322-20121206/14091_1 /TAXON_ID=163516 /ORGANISM="Leptocylindrus danicus var. apora, Strain B651" /LENGTH=39 /DNA_ID= /DNA_START= /DNA_END= /DNA_ORIENTATION=